MQAAPALASLDPPPPLSFMFLADFGPDVHSPRASCCPVQHSWAALGFHVPGSRLSFLSLSLDSCRRWQIASVQRTACMSDLGGFIAVSCFTLLKTCLYLLHDPGRCYCPTREVIGV